MSLCPRTPLLQIDGQNLPRPNEAPQYDFADSESSDSGADESGVYHREVLRYGVLSCTIKYDYLQNADCAYLLGLLEGRNTFQFTCPVPGSSAGVEKTITRTCYCENQGLAVMCLRQGIWQGIELKIKEC